MSQTILAKYSHAQILRSEDREAFETLMDACRSYASAGGNAVQPVPFEPMVMSILLSHQIELQRLRKEQDEHKHSCKAP